MSESLQTGSLETDNLSGPQKSSLGNPLEDLREFAKTSLAQHEMMQAATRRELSARSEEGIRRSFIEMPAPRVFADPPQKPRKGAGIKDESTELRFDVLPKREGTSPSFTYKVAVTHGYVAERIPGDGDAMGYYEPSNILDGDDLRLFAIADGQAIYVVVEQQADGTIGGGGVDGPVYLLVDVDDKESIHYQPQVDTETSAGVAGTMYYKLASFAISAGELTMTKFMAGSNIDHYQELPKIKSTAGIDTDIGVIPKKWDNTAGAYQLRALEKGLGQLGITTGADLIEIRGNKIGNEFVVSKGDTELSLGNWEFRDGLLLTGQEIEGDEDPPVEIDPALEINLPIVQAREATLDAPVQIQVTETGAKASTYIVEGNGNNTYIRVVVDDVEAFNATFVDGLLTDGPHEASITTGGTTLPDGSQGDMLYWDDSGPGWTLLANPGAPTSPNRTFLTHDGTVPAWVEMEAKEISICEGGTPVTKTIYVDI